MDAAVSTLATKALSRRTFVTWGWNWRRGGFCGMQGQQSLNVPACECTSTLQIMTSSTSLSSSNTSKLSFTSPRATGKGMASTDALNGAGTTKVLADIKGVPFGATGRGVMAMKLANKLAQTELDHLRFLQKAIKANEGKPSSSPR